MEKIRRSTLTLAVILLAVAALMATFAVGLFLINESPYLPPNMGYRVIAITASCLVIPAVLQAIVLLRVRARYPVKSGKAASFVAFALAAAIGIVGLVATIIVDRGGIGLVSFGLPLAVALIICGIAFMTARIPAVADHE